MLICVYTVYVFVYVFVYFLFFSFICCILCFVFNVHIFQDPRKNRCSIAVANGDPFNKNSKLKTSASSLFPVCHYWINWLMQVCLTSVVTTSLIRHTWINQVCPIMADRKQWAGLSSGSSAAVHKANSTKKINHQKSIL